MSGYTPLFASITNGTLCGKWPDIGLWPIVLALSDKHGRVDVHPNYIATVTGLPVAEVEACMARFCSPDPHSRTGAEAGARLVLLEEHRDWGWQIVNHGKYREKARLMGKDAARTASGLDAERKRKERASPDVPRSPPESPSQTHTHTQTKKEDCAPSGRAPDLLAEALAGVCQLDLKRLTPAERGRFNKALKGLRSVDASPDAIRTRAGVYRRLFADCSLTPTGLEANWGKCDPNPPKPAADQAKAAETARLVELSAARALAERMAK